MDKPINQLPPQDIEAEEAVLGSIFLENGAMVTADSMLTADDFYKNSHRAIFQAFKEITDRNEPIDVLTVQNQLTKMNQLEDVGGMMYLTTLVDNTPSAQNIEYYSKIVAEKAQTRRLLATVNEITRDSYSQEYSADELLEVAEQKLQKVAQGSNLTGFKPIKDILSISVDEIQERSKNEDKITGLSTGYADLDRITSGLHEDELIIIGARPGVGKTAFVLNIAQNIATKTDETVAIFSLEMGATSLINRMICAEGAIDSTHLKTGQLDQSEWSKLMIAVNSLSGANIFIDDTPGLKISQIRAQLKKLEKEQGKIGLVAIDYLQLIEGSGRESRQQEVSEISRQLKKIAKEMNVPVIALSQLSRGVEQRQNKRPVLSDIRESGSIEQDADIVAFLYRDDYYHSDESSEEDEFNDAPRYDQPEDDNVGEVEVIIEKNRAGARGTINLMFIKSFNKFASLSYANESN